MTRGSEKPGQQRGELDVDDGADEKKDRASRALAATIDRRIHTHEAQPHPARTSQRPVLQS